MIKINLNDQVIDWPANQPLPAGATIVVDSTPTPTPTPNVVPSSSDMSGWFAEQKANQFYLPVEGGERTVSTTDLQQGLTASLKERFSPYNGGSMVVHLDLQLNGERRSVKVSGAITEAIREKKIDFASVKVTVPTIVITRLKKTNSATKEMKEFIEGGIS